MERTLARALPHEVLIDSYLKSLSAETTKASYGLVVGWLSDWCDSRGLRLVDLNRGDVERFLDEISDGRQATTRNARFNALKSFFRYLAREGLSEPSPMSGMTPPEVPKRKSQAAPLSTSELSALLAAAANSDHDVLAITGLLVLFGLRPHEISSLRVESLVPSRPNYILRIPGRPSDLAVPEPVATALIECVGARRSGPLILNRGGRELSSRNIRDRVELASRLADLDGPARPQTIRNSVVDAAVESGMSDSWVAQDLGISTYRVAQLLSVRHRQRESLAFRMTRILLNEDTNDDLMDHVHRLVEDQTVHPAAPAILAGVALERNLRNRCLSANVHPNQKRPGIMDYSGALRSAGLIEQHIFRKVEVWSDLRNNAAHGHFDRFDRDDVREATEGISAFLVGVA